MWTYAQKTGNLLQNGQVVATGYSGCDDGKNNPAMQAVHDVGPIPQGDWTISGPPINTAEHGPYVLTLTAAASTNVFGRSGFLMHGDSIAAPGTASKGCIIMPRTAREQVWNSGDRALQVVPEFATQDLQGANA
jgi:type VI secretion system (T6SS) effector TldE1-like protein